MLTTYLRSTRAQPLLAASRQLLKPSCLSQTIIHRKQLLVNSQARPFYLNNALLFANKQNDDEQNDEKAPKGFEKFFRKNNKEEPKAKEDLKDEKETKGKEDPDLSEEEEPEKKEESKSDERNKVQQMFFEEDNSPRPEGWLGLVLALATGWYLFNYKKPMQEIVYMQFLNDYLLQNKIKEINITKDRRSEVFNYRAVITTHDDKQMYMTLNSYEQFLAKLDMVQREMGKSEEQFIPAKFTNQDSADNLNSQIMNILIGAMFLAFFLQIYRGRNGKMNTGKKTGKTSGDADKKKGGFFGGGGMGDMFGMGKSNAKQFGGEDGLKIKTRFKHVAGNQAVKYEIQEFVDFLKDPKKYQKLGARVPRGALLVGPPGTGKTLLAKAVAGEAKVPFFTISGSDFVEMFVGVGASRVRDLFKKARAKAPSIIFIDEIDAVGKKRNGGKGGGGNEERDNTLNQLLVEMDGFSTDTSVIVMAATNRADILDNALLRPGRFDRQIEVQLPSLEERCEIFKVHLRKITVDGKYDKDTYAKKLSTLTPGFSGADIENICNEGAIMAARGNKDSVDIRSFELATERVIAGIEKSMPKNEVQRRTVAYHECGHAVAGWFSEHSAPLLKLTIIPRAKGSLGFAQYLPDEASLQTKEQLCDMITVALGGRIAEEIFFGKITTGASDDIKKCTQIAQGMVGQYGMTESLGAIRYSAEDGYQKSFSERTGRMIDQEVKNIINTQYHQCRDLLNTKKDKIEELAVRLLEKETLALPDIVEILGPRPFPMKANILEYLDELRERDKEDEQIKIKEEEDAKNLADSAKFEEEIEENTKKLKGENVDENESKEDKSTKE